MVAVLWVTAALVLGACSGGATPGPVASQNPTGRLAASVPAASTAAAPAKTSGVPAASAAPATAGIVGSWSGTWQNTTPTLMTGPLDIIVQQQGTALYDTIARPADCNSGGYGTVTVAGSAVSFTVSCVASCGPLEFKYTGSITGDTMSGTYAGGGSGACPGLTGTWKATRT